MTYEEFKKELYRNLQQGISQGRQILLLEKGTVFAQEDIVRLIRLINLGNYGREETVVREDMICVVWKKKDVVSMIHWSVRPVYERYKREGWQGVLPEMVSKLHKEGQNGKNLPSDGCVPESERLMIRLLHYPDYREELEESIYWKFGDIALVLYLLVYESAEEYLTVKVNRDMLKIRDMSDETLLTNALLNTYAKMPPRLCYGTEIACLRDRANGVFMPEEKGDGIAIHPDSELEGLHGYLLTAAYWPDGAVALFYPGVKERLAELLDGDYYVGFTSVHEAMIYPARHKVLRELKAAIQSTNLMFDRREMLTNRVYRYSCSRKELIEV